MTLPTLEEARSWRGLTLVATDQPVGRIDAVYLDRTTRKPEWVLVNTGLFGTARTFVPLADAAKVGDTVQVPHDPAVVREAPRVAPDVELSESEEAQLYAHYGIDYSTAASPSGLPASEAGTAVGTAPTAGTVGEATTELPRPVAATPPRVTSRLEADTIVVQTGLDEGRSRRPLLVGLGAFVLAAAGAALALLRARRRRPPTLGERLTRAGRDTVGTLTRTVGSIGRAATLAGTAAAARQAATATSGAARQAAAGSRRAARKAAAQAAVGGSVATVGGRRAARKAARRAAVGGAAAAAGGRLAARRARKAGRKAGRQAGEAGRQAAEGGRRFARAAASYGREAGATAAGAAKAGATAAAGASKAAAAGASKAVSGFPTAGGRRLQRLDLGRRGRKVRKQARQAVPRRRRRSRMKVMGKLGMVVGAAVGYVLGSKAGRERYDQIAASARQLMEKPQVKRVMESAPGNLGARVEQVAGKAADAVHQAGDRVASGTGTGGGTGGTSGPGGAGGGTTPTGPRPVPSATGSGSEEGSPRGSASGDATTGGTGSGTGTGTGPGTGTTGRRGSSSGGAGSREQPKGS
jgi:hypothetical protein